jgi:5-methylcytosine-specific restriction endonuclease McrA
MMKRRNWTTKRRLALFNTHDGICHLCKGKIESGQAWEVEHVIAIELGGDDDEANCRPAHFKCHKAKTRDDVGKIAKAKRVEARHTGASRPKGNLQSRGFDKVERPKKPGLPPKQMFRIQ